MKTGLYSYTDAFRKISYKWRTYISVLKITYKTCKCNLCNSYRIVLRQYPRWSSFKKAVHVEVAFLPAVCLT